MASVTLSAGTGTSSTIALDSAGAPVDRVIDLLVTQGTVRVVVAYLDKGTADFRQEYCADYQRGASGWVPAPFHVGKFLGGKVAYLQALDKNQVGGALIASGTLTSTP